MCTTILYLQYIKIEFFLETRTTPSSTINESFNPKIHNTMSITYIIKKEKKYYVKLRRILRSKVQIFFFTWVIIKFEFITPYILFKSFTT